MGGQIVAYEEHRGDDHRYVEIRLDDDDLVVSGQDLGPAVERFWDADEYEWAMAVRAPDIPTLRAAMGRDVDEDILTAIRAWIEAEPAPDVGALIRDSGVPHEFDSWVSS